MKNIQNKFGLRIQGTNKLMSFRTESNGPDADGISESYRLEESDENDPLWLVDTPEHAGYVRDFSTPWYNADYDTPMHPHLRRGEKLEVVEVNVSVNVEPVNVNVPTKREFFKERYKDNPSHLKYLLEDISSISNYSLYDYKDLLRQREEAK